MKNIIQTKMLLQVIIIVATNNIYFIEIHNFQIKKYVCIFIFATKLIEKL